MLSFSRGAAGVAAICVLLVVNHAEARVEVEAFPGRPFGVGRITINRGDLRGSTIDENAVQITETGGRVHYPAIRYGRFGALIGEALGIGDGAPGNVTILFLFTGERPLRITVYTPEAIEVDVTPRARGPRDHDRLLTRWWRDYHAMIKDQRAEGDFPPWVQTYLSTMLSRRLKLESPLFKEEPVDEGYQVLELLAGSERVRDAALRDTVLDRFDFEAPAEFPLPPAVDWPELEIPYEDGVEIEAIVSRVPREFGYIRFGRFANFLWFNKLLEEYGGDLGRLVTTRGFQQTSSTRLQTQLQLRTDALAELLGETVISDVALVGRDFFLQEGPAMGVLFEARNNALLTNDFTNKRKAALEREKGTGCTLETVKIAGRDVTFLSTPDNRIRSFYAIDGNYHLVTTSRAMVQRFLETGGGGKTSLAELAEFKHARSQMPLKRADTVFAYFSSWFLRGLVSPHYQVELRRRMQSVTDIEVLQLAQLAARGEGLPADRIDDLIDQRFVAPGFGRRPDGSGIVLTDDAAFDSLRGKRGVYAPIPDIEIASITAEEARRCTLQAQYYVEHWKQMDPLYVGIRRFKKNDMGLERIVVDAHISPFEETKYGQLASMLGPPTSTRISAAPGDVIQVQAFLKGGPFDPGVRPHHMFLGVQDHVPLQDLKPTSLLKTLQLLKTTPGYIGAWPKTGFLDRLPLGLGGGAPDEFGYSKLLFGLWRRQGDGFSVLSFDPNLLAEVTPQLAVEEASDEAQVRIHVGDLAKSKISGLVNTLYFEQARRTSVGNARFMQSLVQQCHVPVEDAKAVAEKLLDAELVCTLGGDYEIASTPSGAAFWSSSAWPSSLNYRLPRDYTSPLMVWFRGLDAGLTKSPNELVAHIELDMQRQPGESPKLELPQLPLFNLFGSPKPEEKKDPEDLPPPKKLFPKNPPPRPEPPRREF